MAETDLTTTKTIDQPQPSAEEGEIETNNQGMWVFLSSEVMFFGVLFTVFLIYSHAYPQAFAEASRHLNLLIGSVNTAILLTSSFAMALAMNAVKTDRRASLVISLLAVVFFGLVFLGLKAVEYFGEFRENLFPGGNFIYTGSDPQRAKLFFSLYFTMTGLHALHVLIGILAISILALLAWRKHFNSQHYVPVEIFALFWHFIDIVWIFLFPVLYLIGRS